MDFLSMYYLLRSALCCWVQKSHHGEHNLPDPASANREIRRLGCFESTSSRSLFSERLGRSLKLLSVTLALSVCYSVSCREDLLTSAILRSSYFSLLETLVPAIRPLFISET